MVTDERGRDVPVVRELRSLPGPIAVWRKRTSVPPRVAGLLQGLWIAALYALVKGAIVTGLLAYAALSTTGMSSSEIFGQILFIPLSVLGMVAVLVLGTRSVWAFWGRGVSARLMASRGRCPSCASSLAGIPPGADGAAQCASCGAAWRVGSPASCPGCGYDLSGLSVERGGSTTCPECSAVWPAATDARLRTEQLAYFGAMRDDAGDEAPRQSNAKRRRVIVKPRAKDARERARLPGFFLWLGVAAAVFLVVPAMAATASELFGLILPDRGAEFAGGIAALAGVAVCVAGLLRYAAWAQRYESRRLAICPACDADLRGVSPGEAGLTPCPNCHARWKLPPQPVG